MTRGRSPWPIRIEFAVLLVLSLLPLLFLIGCHSPSAEATDQSATNWRTLPDGSRFAHSEPDDPQTAFTAVRCWPAKEAAFECLEASENYAGGAKFVNVTKTERNALPGRLIPQLGDNGYTCGRAMERFESITRSGAELQMHPVAYDNRPWSKGFVNRYIADNDVNGPSWFPCLSVLSAIESGSLETLSTTSVTKAMIGR